MKKRILNSILFTLLTFICITLFVKILELINFKCFYEDLFGIACAGCGATRMFKSILKLDIYQAFRYNPLMFILTILGFIYFIINIILYIKGKKLIKLSFKFIFIIIIILLIYMFLRNLPGFEYLLPTKIK